MSWRDPGFHTSSLIRKDLNVNDIFVDVSVTAAVIISTLAIAKNWIYISNKFE